jgi:hypothetical protein
MGRRAVARVRPQSLRRSGVGFRVRHCRSAWRSCCSPGRRCRHRHKPVRVMDKARGRSSRLSSRPRSPNLQQALEPIRKAWANEPGRVPCGMQRSRCRNRRFPIRRCRPRSTPTWWRPAPAAWGSRFSRRRPRSKSSTSRKCSRRGTAPPPNRARRGRRVVGRCGGRAGRLLDARLHR